MIFDERNSKFRFRKDKLQQILPPASNCASETPWSQMMAMVFATNRSSYKPELQLHFDIWILFHRGEIESCFIQDEEEWR